MESGASSWDRSVSEVKGQSLARLQDDLRKAHDELRLKDEQISRLTRIRTEVEAELEELTASLFQVSAASFRIEKYDGKWSGSSRPLLVKNECNISHIKKHQNQHASTMFTYFICHILLNGSSQWDSTPC